MQNNNSDELFSNVESSPVNCDYECAFEEKNSGNSLVAEDKKRTLPWANMLIYLVFAFAVLDLLFSPNPCENFGRAKLVCQAGVFLKESSKKLFTAPPERSFNRPLKRSDKIIPAIRIPH